MTPIKIWMKQPGECHDRKGVPIYPGDLLKSFHFTGGRGKKHWHYHIAVMCDGAMRMVNTETFGKNVMVDGMVDCGNKLPGCMLSHDLAAQSEVISGYGPGKILSFEDRPKYKEQS